MTLRRTLTTATTAALSATLIAAGGVAAQAAPTPAPSYTRGSHMTLAVRAFPWLGAPLSGETYVTNGWYRQRFTYALAFTNGSSAHTVRNSYLTAYSLHRGVLLYPLGPAITVRGGTMQWFKGGRIYQATGHSAFAVAGAKAIAYSRAGAQNGYLGMPLSSSIPFAGGSYQQFQYGRIYQSGYGAYAVPNRIDAPLRARGGVTGWLGWPKGQYRWVPGASAQSFAGGRIYVSPSLRTVALSNAKMAGIVPPTGPAAFAVDQIGDTYRLFATGPNAWDCSSLVQGSFTYSSRYVGVGTRGIRNTLPAIPRAYMRPGDVMWWPGHVAIYLGKRNGVPMLVNAMNPTYGIKTVPVSMVDSYSGYGTALRSPLRA